MLFNDALSCRFQYIPCNSGGNFTHTWVSSIAPTNPLKMDYILDVLKVFQEFGIVIVLLEFWYNCMQVVMRFKTFEFSFYSLLILSKSQPNIPLNFIVPAYSQKWANLHQCLQLNLVVDHNSFVACYIRFRNMEVTFIGVERQASSSSWSRDHIFFHSKPPSVRVGTTKKGCFTSFIYNICIIYKWC